MTSTTEPGRVLHTGQAIVDLALRIPRLPPLGGDVFSTRTQIAAGGGFNVMAAARRDGAEVVYLGTIGDGPFAQIVTDALHEEGIVVAHPPIAGMDTGFSVAMVDATAERTFVTAPGAENCLEFSHLQRVRPRAADIVYVTGYSLLHTRNRVALTRWIPTLDPDTTIVFDPSPQVADIPDDAWDLMVERATIWTVNAREAALAAQRFGEPVTSNTVALLAPLVARISGTVLLRNGDKGTWISGERPTHIAGHPVVAVDTNGAGDAHTGVLAAALATGMALPDAVRRATVAAAIAVTRFGPATAPRSAEIDRELTE